MRLVMGVSVPWGVVWPDAEEGDCECDRGLSEGPLRVRKSPTPEIEWEARVVSCPSWPM